MQKPENKKEISKNLHSYKQKQKTFHNKKKQKPEENRKLIRITNQVSTNDS